jgi:tetratricopeptide (TPR) repeat protein
VDLSERQDVHYRIGGEYQVASPLALRAGYDGFGPTAGVSVRYKSFRFDYAFVSPSPLGVEHRVGLSIDIGRPIDEQRRLRDQRIDYEVAHAIGEEKKAQRLPLEAKADSALASGDWDEAALAYAQLASLFPDASYQGQLDVVSHKRDSAYAAQIEQATQRTSVTERSGLLDSLTRRQMAEGQWAAALATAKALAAEPGPPPSAAPLGRAAADSLAAETQRAIGSARQALGDSAYVEAAGWARLALFYDSGNGEAILMLDQAKTASRRQASERELLSAAAAGDSQAVVRKANELLAEQPDHELARTYLARFSPAERAVPIETIQADSEAWTWYTRAFGAFREGRFDEAIEWWEKVLQRYPTSADTRKNLEQARLRQNSGGNR